GRFDRRVAVQAPDRAGRKAILDVHTRGMPLGPDVDLSRIAASTPGMVGADLANLVNEAALMAARRNHEKITESDFTDSLERIVLGAERQIMMTPGDRKRTAYHEGGHALVGMLTEGADPVRKISIIPRGMALGVTFSAPETDRFNYEESELKARLKVALGGRVAEEIIYGEPTTGAESDIAQLTEIVRQMVGRWGMSPKIGPLAVVTNDGRGAYYPGASEVSERTQELIDDEMRRIVDEAHGDVVKLLTANRGKLDSLAEALLEHETLDEDDAYAAAGVERKPDETSGQYSAAARAAAPPAAS
ncbi:MAG TPA: cell division protein FtsH, partial [Gaiellaceae bacterium]|nr:cell division protein FtsH [Gaiellaceae bacterium]